MIRLFYISAPSDSPRFYQTSIETNSLQTAIGFLNLYAERSGLEIPADQLQNLATHRCETCGRGGYPILGFERLLPEPLIEDAE